MLDINPFPIKADVDKQSLMFKRTVEASWFECVFDEDIRAGKSGEAKIAINQFDFDQIKALFQKRLSHKA